MWTCQCGEQIEDQFNSCWKCGGTAAKAVTPKIKESLAIECPRCKTALQYLGRKCFLEGGRWRSVLGDAYNRVNFDLYACARCGHVEFFLKGAGEEIRSREILKDRQPEQ